MSFDEFDGEGPGRRCTICGIDWPMIDEYRQCPSCLEPTDKCSNITPISEAEAEMLKVQCEFERFYEEWDETHSPERLSTVGLPDYRK